MSGLDPAVVRDPAHAAQARQLAQLLDADFAASGPRLQRKQVESAALLLDLLAAGGVRLVWPGELLVSEGPADDYRTLLGPAVALPLRADACDYPGLIVDAHGREIITVDAWRDHMTDSQALAVAGAVVVAVNTCAGYRAGATGG